MDGLLYFYESKDERLKIIVQVKGGGVATLPGEAEKGLRGCCGGFKSSFEAIGEPFSQLGRCLEFLQVSSLIHHFRRHPIRKCRCLYFMAT